MKNLFTLFLLFTSTTSFVKGDFSGFYGGLVLGHVTGQDEGDEFNNGVKNEYITSQTPEGEFVGLVGGFGHIINDIFLIGVETDFEIREADEKGFFYDEGEIDTQYPFKVELKNMASLRFRLGYLLNNERTLLYTTGGYVVGEVKRTYGNSDNEIYQSETEVQHGWTAGLGVGHFITNSLSLNLEYRYSYFRHETTHPDKVFGPEFTEKHTYDEQSIRIGLLHHF